MRLNKNVKVIGERVILVPYEKKFVPKYHEWMKNEELQELTASSPLTLEEEYEMQNSWRDDEDKLTFLIMCKETYNNYTGDCDPEIEALVGDTNLFLHNEHGDDDHDNGKEKLVAEAEIMIAEPNVRKKGYGTEAMLLMFTYALAHLPIQKLEAKIGMSNTKSLSMFKKLHFNETSSCEVFKEVTLTCDPTDVEWVEWLHSQVNPTFADYTL